MDDMNAFKADLAAIREGESSLGQVSPAQNSREISNSNHDDIGESSPRLGRALVVLFQARPSALQKALKDGASDGVLSRALQTLVQHVEMAVKEDGVEDESAQFQRMREVYKPMLDKLLKKANGNEKEIAYILLDWLLKEFKHKDIMSRSVLMDLESLTDKKQKLAILMALNFTIVEQGTPLLLTRNELEASALPLDGSHLVEYTRLLATIVQKDSLLQPDGTKAMTKLTAMALDLALMITCFLAENIKRIGQTESATESPHTNAGQPLITVQHEVDPMPFQWFLESFKSVPRIIRELQAWTPRRSSLKHAALKDIAELATKLKNTNMKLHNTASERENILQVARLWIVIMPSISTSTASLSLQSNVRSIQSHIAAGDRDPGARIIFTSMMLGYVDPAISLKDLFTGKLFPVSDVDLFAKVFELASSVIVGHQPIGRHSAYAIQQNQTLTLDENQIRAHLPKMLSLLAHQDEVSKAAAEMIANYAIAFPTIILPEIVNRLKVEHDEVVRIWNILAVVDEMADQGFLTAPLETEADMMRGTLIDVLLSKLNDNDLKTRMTSSRIAAAIDPSKLVHTLVPVLLSESEKARSSAELTLVECLLAQRKDRPIYEGLIALVDAIRRVSLEPTARQASKAKAVKSPGELLAQKKRSLPSPSPTSNPSMNMGPSEDALRLERVARVIHKWAEAVPPTTWPLYVDRLVVKTYGSPSDQNLIRVWKEVSNSIASSAEGMASLLESVLLILEQQGTITTEELEQAVEASDEAIDDLRYARLSPLLILKTIPPEGYINLFRSTSEETRALSQRALSTLKARTENPVEFNHVRQMAFALMPSMFPNTSLEKIYSQMTDLLSSSELAFDDIKSWVISLYNWITAWTIPTASQEQLKVDIKWLCMILRDALLPILAIPMPTDESSQALYKLQLGVTDALSQLILTTAPYHKLGTPVGSQLHGLEGSTMTPKIQEITDLDELTDLTRPSIEHPEDVAKPSDFFTVLLTAILEQMAQPVETNNPDQIGVAVCMSNSLILTMQRLFQGPPPSSSPPTDGSAPVGNLNGTTLPRFWIPSILLDLVTPTLAMIIHRTLKADASSLQPSVEGVLGFDMLLAGCFQVMYTGVNAVAMVATHPASHSQQQKDSPRTTSRTTDQGMMDVVVAGLESEQLRVAVAALKLLGTMAATGTVQEAGLLTPLNLTKIRRGLGWLGSANVKASEKMPEIAPLLDKMWEMVA